MVNRQRGEAAQPLAFRKLFETAAGGPLPEWERFAGRIVVQSFEPGEVVFRQNADHPYMHIVRQGLLKACYLTENGTEWVKGVAYEGIIVASLPAFRRGGRTAFAVDAIEHSILERIDYALLRELSLRHLPWSIAVSNIAIEYIERRDRREWELLTLTPRQRYLAFRAANPGLEERIPQKYLARMLGMTPVGLNRIVSRERRM